MRWSGPPKSRTPRLVTTWRSSWCSFTQSPSSAARSYPTPDTTSTFSTNTRGECARDPVAGDVLHRVAGRAAHAEQLRLRLRGIADEREVLVAERVDLRRAHHHVAAPRPHDVEHRAVRVPRLDGLRRVGVADRDRCCSPAAPRRRSSPGRARTRSRASRPPMAGMVPMGLAMISPSPRKHSATPIDAVRRRG